MKDINYYSSKSQKIKNVIIYILFVIFDMLNIVTIEKTTLKNIRQLKIPSPNLPLATPNNKNCKV